MIQKILLLIGNIALMVGTMSGVMTYANQGFSETFLSDWFNAFVFSIFCVVHQERCIITHNDQIEYQPKSSGHL